MSKITEIIAKSINSEYMLDRCPNCDTKADIEVNKQGICECDFCGSSWISGPENTYFTIKYRGSIKISFEQLSNLSDAELALFKNPNTIYTCGGCHTAPLYFPEHAFCPECGEQADVFDCAEKMDLSAMKYHADSVYAGEDWACAHCHSTSAAIAEFCYKCGSHKEIRSQGARGEQKYAKFQMLWDCPACQTKGLLGIDHRFCPNCGSAQKADKRYFPPEGEEVEAQNHQFSGADWVCQYCETPNANLAQSCPNCGGSKDGTKGPKRAVDENFVPPSEKIATEHNNSKGLGKFKWPAIGCGGFLVLFFGFLIFSALWTKEEVLAIDHHSWATEVKIKTFVEYTDSSFCDQMNAKLYKGYRSKIEFKKSKEFEKKKIQDGEICSTKKVDKGDGTFVKQKFCEPKYIYKPIMKDFCFYSNAGWVKERVLQASGEGLNFSYPEYQLKKEGQCIGCEKLADKNVYFKLNMLNEGKMNSCTVDRKIWDQFVDGQKVVVKVKKIGGGLNCDDLETPQK